MRDDGLQYAARLLEAGVSVELHQFAGAFHGFDAERIEVLRELQGTLYGKNTMGGAISIISRDPGDHLAAWSA